MDQRDWNLQNQNGNGMMPGRDLDQQSVYQNQEASPEEVVSGPAEENRNGFEAAGMSGNPSEAYTDASQNRPGSYAGAAVFSGSGEAAVDYNVAKGASLKVDTMGSFRNTDSSSYEQVSGAESYYSDGYTGYTGYAQAGGSDTASDADPGYADNGYGSGNYAGGYYNANRYAENSYSRTQGYRSGPKAAPKPAKPRKKLSDKAKRFLAGALIVVLSGAAGFGGATLANRSGSVPASSPVSHVKITGDVTSVDAASAIAEKVMPSVVGISTISQSQTETIFGIQSGTVQGIGTGIIVSEDGYILTNSHVVNDGNTEKITVDLYDGTEHTGSVLWNDASLDLAIVKIDAKNLTAAELGDADKVNIGDYALAIGNPLGLNYERSVTSGIISGLNRTITTQDSSTGSVNNMDGLIQTDAAINSGNSGGPLINSKGQVIGINTAKASSSEGLGFAIPINTATPIVKQIKEKGSYEQTYIGISGVDLSQITASYQTDFKADDGVYIMQIYTDSPAAAAGLKEGDIITEIDGKAIDGMSALKSRMINYSPGDEIELTIEREKSSQKIKLTLASSSDAGSVLQSNENSQTENSGNGSGNYGGSGSYDGSGSYGGSGMYGGSGSYGGFGGFGDFFGR